jgi:endogenous inhibitor of DNA gyrase (YacG/DUF329 family)
LENAGPKLIEMPRMVKPLPCSKCGKNVLVKESTVMVFCGECSKNMGEKK